MEHRDSTTRIVHADVILIRSKVKVKVTRLLNVPIIAENCTFATSISSTILARSSKLMFRDDSIAPALQLF